jgi:hypothetical protein
MRSVGFIRWTVAGFVTCAALATAQSQDDDGMTRQAGASLPPIRTPRSGTVGIPTVGRSGVMAGFSAGASGDGADLSLYARAGSLVLGEHVLMTLLTETARLDVPTSEVTAEPNPNRSPTLSSRLFTTAGFRLTWQPMATLSGDSDLADEISICLTEWDENSEAGTLAAFRTLLRREADGAANVAEGCSQFLDPRADYTSRGVRQQIYDQQRSPLVNGFRLTAGLRALYSPEEEQPQELGLSGELILAYAFAPSFDLFVSGSVNVVASATRTQDTGASIRTFQVIEGRWAAGLQFIVPDSRVLQNTALMPRIGLLFVYQRNWWTDDLSISAGADVSGYRIEGAAYFSFHTTEGISLMLSTGLSRPYGYDPTFDGDFGGLEFFLRLEPFFGRGV